MKKLISTLTVLAMLAGMSALPVMAADNEPTDLNALASSLGADTDYLKFNNYKHDDDDLPVPLGAYNEYLDRLSILEAYYAPVENFSQAVGRGSCFGIAVLEVLAHNGVISPSDIDPGAKSLSEVTYIAHADRVILSYQCRQTYIDYDNYEKYLITSLGHDEQIDRLIETAERNMAENRYFLISMRAKKFSHAVCGIGIADGNWEFNGSTYDKCILTLDSNANQPENGIKGFTEKSCIYINSETKDCYIPMYDLGADSALAFAVIDDDSLLNYKGMINPSETVKTDTSFVTQISHRGGDSTKLYSVDAEGNMTPVGTPMFGSWLGPVNLIDGVAVHADIEDEEITGPAVRYINSDRWIEVSIDSKPVNEAYNATIDISDNKARIETKGVMLKEVGLNMRLNDGTYNFAPYFNFDIFGMDLTDDLEVELKDRGFLISSSGRIKASVNMLRYLTDADGSPTIKNGYLATESVYPDFRSAFITSDNNVLLTVNDDREYEFYIDKDKDGEYEFKVQKGDVNFDGFIDSRDASDVLSAYSALSTGKKDHFINKALADYNDDGYIDARDASDILRKYSELSTGNF